jgi:hypothetical protein
MKRRQDPADSVPLVELLEAADVGTPGQLVDLLSERGDAVVVDPFGRLAVYPAVAERLRAEREERERVALEEAKRAEEERLAKLRELAERQEADQARQARELALRERMRALEQATGLATWQLEMAVRKARTNSPGMGMTLGQRAIADEEPVTLGEVEEYVRETFGPEALEGDA